MVRLRVKQNILKDSGAVQILYFRFEISDATGNFFWITNFLVDFFGWKDFGKESMLNAKKNGLFPVIF